MKKLLYIIFLFASTVQSLFGQYPDWLNYTSGRVIYAAAADSANWYVGTNGGLVQIDKNSGGTIFYNVANSGIPSNIVYALAIDSTGSVWIGTDNGLARFNGSLWTVYNTTNSGIAGNIINDIRFDKISMLWVGTTAGAGRFNGISWTSYKTTNSGIPSNTVYSIEFDSGNNKWIGTAGGLTMFDDTNWVVYKTTTSLIPSNTVRDVAVDQNDKKWLATSAGMATLDDTTWTIYKTNNSGLPSNTVYKIVIDDSVKWIATGSGLGKFNDSTWVSFRTTNSAIPSNVVLSVEMDFISGSVLVGTNGAGFARFNGSSWIAYNTSNSGLQGNVINGFHLDPNYLKWIATSTGLLKYNGNNWVLYRTNNSNIPGDVVLCVTSDHNNYKWIGTTAGLAIFDGNFFWAVYRTTNSGLPSNSVYSIDFDSNGDGWIGTGAGLTKFDGSSWTVYNSSNSGLPNNTVYSVLINEDTLWAATGSGLAKFDGINWTVYKTNNSGIPGNVVRSLAMDSSGTLWIGTTNGAAKFNGTSWTSYKTTNSGLPNNTVVSVEIDSENVKWFGTSGGAARFNGSSWKTYLITNSGLPTATVNAVMADTNGSIYFGTTGGIGVLLQTCNPPLVNFSISDTACTGSNVNVENFTTGALSYQWYKDGALVSTSENLSLVFNSSGTYNIKLIASYGNCKDSLAKAIYISPATLSAGIISSSNSVCQYDSVIFINNSAGEIFHQWKFNNTIFDTNDTASLSFDSAGAFPVTLVAYNSGCIDSVSTIISVNAYPIASIVSADSACAGVASVLGNNTDVISSLFDWQMDGVGFSDATDTSYIFNSAGSYVVTLIANNNGCVDTASKTIIVTDITPVSAFSSSVNSICQGGTVIFNSSSSNANYYSWLIGSAPFSSDANSSYIFNLPGNFQVSLVAFNGGCSDTSVKNITVNIYSAANFTANKNLICTGETVLFTNTSIGGASQFLWQVNGTAFSNSTNSSYTFNSEGNYVIRLIASNGVCLDTLEKIITVKAYPDAEFFANSFNACEGQNILFINATSGANSFNWYQNGIFMTSSINPSISFANAGNYQMRLIAVNDICADTVEHSVNIYVKPAASFSVSDSSICQGETISFFNSSTNNISNNWLHNNVIFSSLQNPVYTFSQSGIHQINLVAYNNGCTDTAAKNINVFPAPYVSISVVFSNEITLDAGSGFQTYLWSNGDTTQTFIASSSGTYSVTVTDQNGCTNVDSSSVITGIELAANSNGLEIFPNPFRETFTILNNHHETLQLRIFDVLGQQIHVAELDIPKTEIRLKNTASGIYYYTLLSEGRIIQTGKLISK